MTRSRGAGVGKNAMTVKELVGLLSALPNQEAEILVQVPDPTDPQVPDEYTIEDVTFMDWPTHYRNTGDVGGISEFSRPQAYIRV